jgi:hypothetical protein
MSRFKVKVGEDFEIDSVEIVEPQPVHDPKAAETEHRYQLSLFVLGFIALFIVGAAVVGFYDGHFGKLQAVYTVAGVPLGWVMSYYFNKTSPPP